MHLGHGPTQVSSLVSGEDDNDGGAVEADADDALAAKGEDLGVEGEGEAGVEEELQEDGAGEGGMGRAGGGAGGGAGPTASGTVQRGSALPPGRASLRHHVRHVPRQSSVANLGPRAANSSGGGGGGGNAGGGGAAGSGLGPLGLGMLGPGGLGGSASAAIAGEQLRRLANELEVMR
ncbi:hypothetical protein Vretifemale_12547 [Volvox reticuliferus]|nr:hypothetical protein Vretifemale_12547 [Volvox reticuliferus]